MMHKKQKQMHLKNKTRKKIYNQLKFENYIFRKSDLLKHARKMCEMQNNLYY